MCRRRERGPPRRLLRRLAPQDSMLSSRAPLWPAKGGHYDRSSHGPRTNTLFLVVWIRASWNRPRPRVQILLNALAPADDAVLRIRRDQLVLFALGAE